MTTVNDTTNIINVLTVIEVAALKTYPTELVRLDILFDPSIPATRPAENKDNLHNSNSKITGRKKAAKQITAYITAEFFNIFMQLLTTPVASLTAPPIIGVEPATNLKTFKIAESEELPITLCIEIMAVKTVITVVIQNEMAFCIDEEITDILILLLKAEAIVIAK